MLMALPAACVPASAARPASAALAAASTGAGALASGGVTSTGAFAPEALAAFSTLAFFEPLALLFVPLDPPLLREAGFFFAGRACLAFVDFDFAISISLPD